MNSILDVRDRYTVSQGSPSSTFNLNGIARQKCEFISISKF